MHSRGRLFSEVNMQNPIQETTYNRYLDLIAQGPEGFEAWKRQLKERVSSLAIGDKGLSCIVINANPFTNGHRYLIELASKRSSHVLVFVIQGKTESGGRGNHETTGIELPFEDRLELVIKGLQDMENVTVVPSGPYLVSRDDYPQGFLSEEMGSAPAHAILDSKVFCSICTSIGAKLAFAGDEPRDELSEIHLNALRQECQSTGIVLRVAERKRLGDRYVSSSLVRDAISKGDWNLVAQLVPEHVKTYLSGHFA